MVYQNNIPQPGDSPAVDSQADLLENFAQLETQFSADHVSLVALANNGMHIQVRFEDVLGADPGLVTPQASLYTKADAVSGDTELFFQNDALATDVVQFTGIDIPNLVNPGTAGGTLYRIDLPVGMTIYSGTTNAFGGNATVTFPVAYTAIYSTTLTANDVNVQRTSVIQAVGGLTVYTENIVQVNWIAIGTI